MKYLTTYKLFEGLYTRDMEVPIYNIIDDISDDIRDIGIEVVINIPPDWQNPILNKFGISLSKPSKYLIDENNKFFKWGEVSDRLLQLANIVKEEIGLKNNKITIYSNVKIFTGTIEEALSNKINFFYIDRITMEFIK